MKKLAVIVVGGGSRLFTATVLDETDPDKPEFLAVATGESEDDTIYDAVQGALYG